MRFLAVMVLFCLSQAVMGQDVQVAPSSTDVATKNRLGLRMDCLTETNRDKGEVQPCFSLSGLRFEHQEVLSPKLTARLQLDPFASVNHDDHPDRARTPLVRNTDLVLVDGYAFIWVPRPHLEVAVESFYSVTSLPSVSGLSMGNSLAAKPWSQTALSVTYNLSAFNGTRVKFVAGNGEGENGKNLDPQQFFGFLVGSSIFTGLNFSIGASLDGNNVGSSQYQWRLARFESICGIEFTEVPKQGFSVQRLAAGLELDGNWQHARGLKVGLGWQRNVSSDLSKSTASVPTQTELEQCPQLAVENLVVEDAGGDAVNTVQSRVIELSASYRILDSYTLGFDYETRLIDSGSVDLFQVCNGFSDTTCVAGGDRTNTLSQSAYTFGGGFDLAESLSLMLEYNRTAYDKNYSQFFYVNRGDKADDATESFNVRLAYNWK